MNLFRKPQPKQEPEAWETYAGEWTPAPSLDLSSYYKERGLDYWHFSSLDLVERIRQSGHVCIKADSVPYALETTFWTDLKLEHGQPVYISSDLSIVRHGAMVRTVEEAAREKANYLIRWEWVNRR